MNQDNSGNIGPLDYGRPERRGSVKRWTKRLALLLLALAAIYGGMLGWLWWGWHRQQQAVVVIEAGGGSATSMYPKLSMYRHSLAVVDWLLPRRLDWLLDRVDMINLGPSAGDGDLASIEHFESVGWLFLNDTKITDAGLVHLKGLTALQQLNLENTQVTDAGLVHLKGLTRLNYLHLDNTRVTDAGVAELRKALPNCDIRR